MGRIYGLEPGPDVRPANGCRVFILTGDQIAYPSRVELDADADEGMATVTLVPTTVDGTPLVDPQAGAACTVSVRTWVRVVPKGQPGPPRTPGAVLYKQGDGSLKWFANDPLPDAAVSALNALAAQGA